MKHVTGSHHTAKITKLLYKIQM